MPSKQKAKLSEDQKDVYHTVDVLNAQLQTLETFIARRFDEISMEINATSQQVDMAEDGIVKRFSEVLEILSAINYQGEGGSAANTGVELEAVIEDTENAANNILDAADRIADYVDGEKDWNDEATREDIKVHIRNDIQEILMACTFQDLTGQRIKNTLDNLHSIEERLSSTFERLGIEVKPNNSVVAEKVRKASSQGEVDELFSASKEEKSGDDSSSQGDIDSMFD
ncbi:MAG: protein phosphatase CheZ [Alphaproteobacteria bacterium]